MVKAGSFLDDIDAGKEPTTAIAPVDETPTALAEWKDFEWADDGTADIAPSFPIIKIVQATSTMQNSGKHAGEFWRSDTEEYAPTIEVVALFSKDTRAYFEEGKDAPSCASDDGVYPRPNQPLWQGQAAPQFCDQCPLSAWKDDNPPKCRNSKVVLVDHEGELAQLRLTGTAIKPFRQFVAKKLKPRKLPLCSQKLHLYTSEESGGGKKWYQLHIDAEALTPTDASQYNAVLRYERQRFEEAVRDTHDAEPQGDGVEWDDGEQPFN